MSDDRLADLATADFSIWLHDLSRERLRSGDLQSSSTIDMSSAPPASPRCSPPGDGDRVVGVHALRP